LAVVNQSGEPSPLLHRLERLRSASRVHNSQAAMAESRVSLDPKSTRIGPAGRHGFGHSFEDRSLRLQITVITDPTGYPAHSLISLSSSGCCGYRKVVAMTGALLLSNIE